MEDNLQMELDERVRRLELDNAIIKEKLMQIEDIKESIAGIEDSLSDIRRRLFENGYSSKTRENSEKIKKFIEIEDDIRDIIRDYKEKKKDAIVGKWIVRITLGLIALSQFIQMFGIEQTETLIKHLF